MITLTAPHQVRTVVGGAGTVDYDRLYLSNFTMSPKDDTVFAQVRVRANADGNMDHIQGTLSIVLSTGLLELKIPDLDIQRRVQLTAGQINSVRGWVTSGQNNIEAGLISIGLISGTQANGV